ESSGCECKCAPGSGLILHNQGLPVGELLEAVRQVPRQRIGRAASPDCYQEPNRALGPLRRRLRQGGDGGDCGNCDDCDPDERVAHKADEWHGNSPKLSTLLDNEWRPQPPPSVIIGFKKWSVAVCDS